MATYLVFALCILVALVLLRLLLIPMKWIWKLLLHGAAGLICLWLINLTAGITGLLIPINPITALIAGGLGLPGIGLLIVIQLF